MERRIHFTKMHGAGNDYIYVDTSLYKVPNPEETSRQWSQPHTGIGSDGLVLIGVSPVPEADFTMRIFNADGSEALMCGNASRCIGKYLFEKGLTRKKDIRLLTLSGVKHLHLEVDGKKVVSVTVDMGNPQITTQSLLNAENLKTTDDGHMLLEADGKEWCGTFVSMGNPHFVIFVDDINEVDVSLYGSLLEHNAAFPERCNIEFAQLLGDNKIRTRVWERGSGITMACGTGACATAVAASLTGRAGRESDIIMDGGTLHVRWDEADNRVYLSGPAEFVFEGAAEGI
ncbi:MAG: diaminopimelate epimerase [Prevotellaceae bacterium]|jgi:diaminopimelate epimerase|nr:diaminopimelate epimerase [Prevotellaceae bacterium]